MKHSRFTEEQLIGGLQQAEAAGVSFVDLRRQNGISDATIYKWPASSVG